MKKDNLYLAYQLEEYADILEATGDNPYKIRAYRRAAHVIQNLKENIYELNKQHFNLTKLPRIGKGIAYTIEVILETGSFPEIKVPQNRVVNELIELEGLGPKRIKLLNEKYHVYTKHKLLKLIREGQLNELGEKLLNKIKTQIKKPEKEKEFLRLYHSLHIVKALVAYMQQFPEIKIFCCGDYRRRQEIIEDLSLVISCTNSSQIFEHLAKAPFVKYLVSQSTYHATVQLSTQTYINIYYVTPATLGISLLFHTGSPTHLQQLIQYATKKGFILNEQGLFKNLKCISSDSEEDIYRCLELTFIEPELREGRGEIEAASLNHLPALLSLDDIKGDLHSHTNETDGQEPLEVMVEAARKKGYEYVAITDHSKHLKITNGLDEKRLLQQIKYIDQLNARSNDILILKSIEVDILEDGLLDLSNNVLKELDLVVCSIHSKFKLDEKKQTERIIKAMDNPYFSILGHATGRLIKSRPSYSINFDRILQAAKERNCFLELNAQPYRLDINDFYCKKAKEFGVKIAISSDAHTTRGFNFMQLGVYQARRGWLQKEDVLNTRSWPDLKKLLRKN